MEALVATLAIQVRRFKLQISANLWENFGDGFLDTTGAKTGSGFQDEGWFEAKVLGESCRRRLGTIVALNE
jgi:hypothetical protein